MLCVGFVYSAFRDGLSDANCYLQNRRYSDYVAAFVPCGHDDRYLHCVEWR